MLKIILVIHTVILSIIYIIVSTASLPLLPYPRSLVELYKNKFGNKILNTTTELPYAFTSGKVPSYFSNSYRTLGKDLKGRRSDPLKTKTGIKRGVDIGVHVKIASTPKYNDNLEKLEDVLVKALKGRLEVLNTTGCPSCDEEEVGVAPSKRSIKPAFKCDEWDSKFRICILERNIGDTVTFYLSTGQPAGHKPKVTWRKEFHIQDSNTRKEYIIEPKNSPENIIIGRKGYELRISPISEIDIGFNMFSATLEEYSTSHNKVSFMIRIVPIDLGFVYVGETIELNIRSYVSLPAESLSFKWYMEKDGEHGTLPSNMKLSTSGSSIEISELRQEQEGILACSVYTNLAFLATKKRFLMKDLVINNDVLKSTPNHDLHFEEESARGRRDPKKVKRSKRDVNVADLVEKALMQPTSTEKQLARTQEKTTTPDKDYDLGKDIGAEEPNGKEYENFSYDLENKRIQDSNHISSGNREPQITKHGYDSLDNSPYETAESQAMSYDDSGSQRINEVNPSVSQLSALSHSNKVEIEPGKKLHSQLSDGKATHHKNQQSSDLENVNIPLSQKNAFDKNEQYMEKNTQNGKNNYASHNEESGIILNIDKIPGPRRISAEEKIAKLISSCYSDFECSGIAICVRSNLKYPGFCRCLPGFYGVGIFCRENIWISKNNFGLDDMHNNNDIPPYSSPPVSEDNN